MKCLIYFGMSSMKEGTSAQLSGRGELHGGARVTTLVTLRKCTLGNKREIKTLKFVLASTKGFKGGLAWIKPSKKDMAVTFSYCPHLPLHPPHPPASFKAGEGNVLPYMSQTVTYQVRASEAPGESTVRG